MLWSGAMSAPDTHRVAAAIWRIESAKLIAVLVRLLWPPHLDSGRTST